MNSQQVEMAWKALDRLKVELPSWGFANTGTRFGKFLQAAAATTIEDKFSDAGQVHELSGAAPSPRLAPAPCAAAGETLVPTFAPPSKPSRLLVRPCA